ncbi:hypothetical protein [Tardiphaga sp. OK245]|uniref:hypothetical protein n=1 Tax=Tardiphaga sp. OK245 TaxID=1855306 RepID=UPI001114D3A0|nr:hypothetical protein [Tardiphaga sp. OK245]
MCFSIADPPSVTSGRAVSEADCRRRPFDHEQLPDRGLVLSRRLTWRNLSFAFSNWDFAAYGRHYFFCAVLFSLRDDPDTYIVIAAWSGSCGLYGEAGDIEGASHLGIKRSARRCAVAVVLAAGHWIADFIARSFTWQGQWWEFWAWLALLAVQTVRVGSHVGSTLFGQNMLITCRSLRMDRNDAFSTLRIGA